jgi:hypothetical protein
LGRPFSPFWAQSANTNFAFEKDPFFGQSASLSQAISNPGFSLLIRISSPLYAEVCPMAIKFSLQYVMK